MNVRIAEVKTSFLKKLLFRFGVGDVVKSGENKMWPREKQFADLLTKQGREWKYPARRFKLKNTTYTPDFYLPHENLYIEVVGTRRSYYSNRNKIAKFKKLYPNIRFIIVDYKGNSYPHSLKNIFPLYEIRKTILLRLPKDFYKKIREVAREEKWSINQTGEIAIEFYLKARRKI